VRNSSPRLFSIASALITIVICITLFSWYRGSKEKKEFIEAVTAGNLQKVEEMLVKSPSLVNSKNKEGRTALTVAVWKRDLEMMKLLLEHKADVNVRDSGTRGFMPLHWAASGGYLDCVELLLANNADVHARTYAGWCSLYYALRLDGTSPMNKEMAELLLSHHADVNVKYEGGKTLLHFAAMKTRSEAVKWLLSKGADRTAKTDKGETPLDYATKWGTPEIVSILQ